MENREIVLVDLGTPDAPRPADVRRFLTEFLSDPQVIDLPRWLWFPLLHGVILPLRSRRAARLYRQIWTEDGSPLLGGLRRMAASLDRELGGGARVRPALRYGKPSLREMLESVARMRSGRGGLETVVIPLFPQRTSATTGTVEMLVTETCGRPSARHIRKPGRRTGCSTGGTDVEGARVAFIPPGCPDYVEALAERCEETFTGMGGRPEHLIVSFHGIPARIDRREGRVYSDDCEITTGALLFRLGWEPGRATLSYQSRFGPGRWLGPATNTVLSDLARRGVGSVAVVCPGFLTAGLETIEEIGHRGRKTFMAAGGREFALVPAVEDHPIMIRSLARVARTHKS